MSDETEPTEWSVGGNTTIYSPAGIAVGRAEARNFAYSIVRELNTLQARVKELEEERDEIELFTQVLSLKGELDISRERIEELEEENLLLQRVALEGPQ